MISSLMFIYIVSTIVALLGLAFREDCWNLYEDDIESTMLVFCPILNTWTAWYVLRKVFKRK